MLNALGIAVEFLLNTLTFFFDGTPNKITTKYDEASTFLFRSHYVLIWKLYLLSSRGINISSRKIYITMPQGILYIYLIYIMFSRVVSLRLKYCLQS